MADAAGLRVRPFPVDDKVAISPFQNLCDRQDPSAFQSCARGTRRWARNRFTLWRLSVSGNQSLSQSQLQMKTFAHVTVPEFWNGARALVGPGSVALIVGVGPFEDLANPNLRALAAISNPARLE